MSGLKEKPSYFCKIPFTNLTWMEVSSLHFWKHSVLHWFSTNVNRANYIMCNEETPLLYFKILEWIHKKTHYKIATFKKTHYKIATFKKTLWLIKPQWTQSTSHVCITYQHMHATCVNSDFVPCEIWQNFTAKCLAACSTPAQYIRCR